MARPQDHQEVPPVSDRFEREDSVESPRGGAVKPTEANSSPVSAPSPSTPDTETSEPAYPSKKRKQLHQSEHDNEHTDSDSDYEWIRVPKGDPDVRDPTELPIIMENISGERKLLWAKMDTGADVSIIAEKIVERLGLTSEIKLSDEKIGISEIGGNSIAIDRKITLTFWAGKKNRECLDVDFFIPKQDLDTDTDGVPDVLLGGSVLAKHHMVMVDPEFKNGPTPGLEVLAKRACEESSGRRTKSVCLGVKYAQVRSSGGSVRR
jgi:hypothetical protein